RDLEELLLAEAEGASDERRGEGLHPPVVALDVGVVEAPRCLDTVLGVAQLRLQRKEVLVGLELRIVLRHSEQTAERGDEWPLRGCLRRRRLAGGGRGRRPGPSHFLEHLAFVSG